MKETHDRQPVASRRRYEEKVLLVLTLIIGAVVSLVVVAFILLTENLGTRLYPAGGAPWRRLLIPVAGALGTGFFLFRYFPNARGSGIPQTKVALFLRDGYISFRTVVGKFSLCSLSLASGIALGREGPSVQVGAGIASVLGRRLGLSTVSVKSLVPAGAAAALAAAFNTPISAVLFSLEEVMGDMQAPVLGSIVLSSATSWIVLHLLLGDEPLFHVPAYQLVHPVEFIFYAVLGVIGGLVSVGFVKLLLWQRFRFMRMPQAAQWYLPAAGGLTVGILGWFRPEVLGVGYSVVGRALNGELVFGTMALLVCLKLVATATCYASGNAGGIFGPSLFIGAMMGGAVGGVVHLLAPDYTGGVGAYALVGMGAAFAGIVRTPMTSVIMIFEITRDYSIIVPLMIANLISYFLSSKLQEEPIYEALQHQDGIHLPGAMPAPAVLLTVAHAYRRDLPALNATDRIERAAGLVDRERGGSPVVDPDGLRGMITVAVLDEAIAAGRGDETVGRLVPAPHPIDELTADIFPHVHADHPLDFAMRRMAESGLTVLPVVSRANIRNLQGTIAVSDIVAAHGAPLTREPSPEEGGPRERPGLPMLAGVLAALAGLAVLAGFFNYFYRSERSTEAQSYQRTGTRLLGEHRYEEAVEQFRKALSISHNTDDRLRLGLALADAGHANEASSYLNQVLRERPQNGPANLGMAHVLAQQGHIDDAVMRYQRAAYGSWPEKPQENRVQARFELIEMLLKAGRRAEGRGELLALAAQAAQDTATRERVGGMLADSGLYKEAGDVYRGIVQHEPRNASAYAGLGEAEFHLGDYAAAEQAFRRAVSIDPSNKDAAQKADVSKAILALDPTVVGLRPEERYRRGQTVLRKVFQEQAQCTQPSGSDAQAARTALSRKRRPPSYTDAADADIALAERIWAARGASCNATHTDEALSVLMTKLVRR
ncbi:MAG TPA: chloride channel protein [Bryobacteraceae bacterium]